MLSEDIGQRNLNFESYRERITNFSNEFELGLFLYIVRRSLLWIVLILLLSFAAANLYLRYTPPTFESRTVLQLGNTNSAQKVLEVGKFYEDNNLQSTVELLRSRFFIAKVLDRLPLKVGYYYKGQILTKELYTQSPFVLISPEVHSEAVRDVSVVLEEILADRVVLAYTLGDQAFRKEVVPGERFRTPHFSGVLQITGDLELQGNEPEGRYYFRINSMRGLVNRFYGQLTVKMVDANAQTIEISCRDNNPFLARDMAAAMAETFIDYDLESKRESAENIVRFIESQKETVFEELRDSETRLQAFRKENKISNMEDLMPMFLARTEEYENKILELRMERGLLDEIEQATLDSSAAIDVYDLIPLLVGTDYESTLAGLIGSLEEMLTKRAELAFEVTEQNDGVLSLDHRIAIQRRLIVESVNTLRKRFDEREKDYLEQIEEFEERFTGLPEKELQFARIERLFHINEKYYTLLLEREIEYRISRAGFVPNNRILDQAAAGLTPIAPVHGTIFLSYLVVGFILCLLIVLVRYILHDN
ncbi:MAG: hypothetical protein KDB75_02985, partial [Flavobacteriales bacterium]|nr:hypothetical protein [Flavobacteriales bacterium]